MGVCGLEGVIGPESHTPPVDRVIAAIATRQFGVLSHRQLLAAGVGVEALKWRLGTGRLHIIHRGVYAAGHRVLGARARWSAAVLACGRGAVLSHRDGGMLWGLVAFARGNIDVTVPVESGGGRHPGIRLHRTRYLPPDGVTRVDGIPVTSLARTLLDLSDVMGRAGLEHVLARASERRFDLRTLGPFLDRHPGRRCAGVLHAIVEEQTVTLTRSELERRFLALCTDHGLPRPLANQRLHGLEVDFHWPEHGLVLETDGYAYHRTRAQLDADHARQNILVLAGMRVVRYSHGKVTHRAAEVAAELRRALARTHARAAP